MAQWFEVDADRSARRDLVNDGVRCPTKSNWYVCAVLVTAAVTACSTMANEWAGGVHGDAGAGDGCDGNETSRAYDYLDKGVSRRRPVFLVKLLFFERVCCERDRRFSPKERKQTDNPRQGWEDGTPPPHRDFQCM